nr:hypothetical protein [Tanacetum cinerariifolium]GFB10260.1 hypothetical protein [Tanacetum cinerariifolium]
PATLGRKTVRYMKSISHSIEISLSPQEANWAIGRPKDMMSSISAHLGRHKCRQHGRMILESVENDPLLWPTVEENGVTRLKKYFELSTTEAIQADCDVKATNIILQGLPPEVYALVSTHKVAKELWERI